MRQTWLLPFHPALAAVVLMVVATKRHHSCRVTAFPERRKSGQIALLKTPWRLSHGRDASEMPEVLRNKGCGILGPVARRA